jgi:hypothetical protein
MMAHIPSNQRRQPGRAPPRPWIDGGGEGGELGEVSSLEDEESSGASESPPPSPPQQHRVEEEQADEDEESAPEAAAPLVKADALRKSVSRKAPRSMKSPAIINKARKKKKRPRDPFDVSKEAFDRDWIKAGKARTRFATEIANRAQTDYKETVIKPATNRHGKILFAFRDRPHKDSTIASRDQLDSVLRVQEQDLVIFNVVLKRGAKTKAVNTLKKLCITGHVRGEDPDPMAMGGALPEDYDDGPYMNPGPVLTVGALDFWLEINGIPWGEEGAIEEMFYFLVSKKSSDSHNVNGEEEEEEEEGDPTRDAFDVKIEREKDAGHYELNYNFCRDTTIAILGNYLSFLHAFLGDEMGHHITLIPFSCIKQWLSTLMWSNIY